MCKISLINNSIVTRLGLRHILEENLPFAPLFNMVSDRIESLEWIEQDQCNLVIIGSVKTDISQLVKKIKAHDSRTRVLIFSDVKYAEAMNILIAGADGFIDQRAEIEEVVLAVTNLIIGKRYWGRQLVKDMAKETLQDHNQCKKISTLIDGHRLSKRQIEVLRALILGESVPVIAMNLGLSPSTVATHKSIAFKKLGITNLVQLVEGFYSNTNYLNQQG